MAMRAGSIDVGSLVGRAQELEVVLQAVESAGHALVIGEAGVGKSAFLAAVGSALASSGFEVFTVSATDGLGGYPFAAIGHLVDGAGADDPTTALAKVIASLTTLTPGSSAVLLVDDAHLLDPWSLHAMVQARASGQLRVVACSRPDERSAHAVAAFGRSPGVRLDLQRLSRVESAELAAAVLGAPLDRPSADRMYAATDGLPLALDQLVRHARSSGALSLSAGLWRWNKGRVDQRLADLLGLRVDRLDPGQRDAIDLLSLVERLPIDVAGELLPGVDFADMEDQRLVRDSVRSGWIEPGHALLRDACLARLAPIRRRSLVGRFVHHLGNDAHADDELRRRRVTLAVELGVPVDTDEIIDLVRWARTNGMASIALGVLHEAWTRRPDAFTGLCYSEGLYGAGRMTEADAVLQAAAPLCGSDDERLRVALRRAHTLRVGLRDMAGGTRVLEDARATLTDPALQLEIAATDAANLLMHGRVSDVIALAELARRVGDIDGSDLARYRLAQATVASFTFAGRLADADTEYADHHTLRPRISARHARGAIIVDTWWAAGNVLAGRARQVEDLIDRSYAEALANDAALPRVVWALPAAMDRWLRGELIDAELYAREAMGAPAFVTAIRPIAAYLLARILHLKGDDDAALELCDEAVDNPAVGIDRTWVASARAISQAALGAGSTARQDALAAAAETVALGQAVTGAYLYHDVVRLGGARAAVGPLTELMDTCEAPSVRWMAMHARGVAGRDPAALVELAAETHAERYTTLSLAFLADASRLARAANEFDVVTRAEAAITEYLAVCQGFADPRANLSTDLGLTERELEVARAAAAGLTDAEIAGELVVSVRTVNAHLRSVYRKLGVGGRRDLRRVEQLSGR